MNIYILGIFILLLPLKISAQLFPLSDHYIYNTLAINPAFAGCHDALSATIQYRDQWVGFHDAPKSGMLSVHTPVHNNRMGLGLLINRNTFGIYKETSLLCNYAYRWDLSEGKLALGLGFGLTAYDVSWDDLEVTDIDDIVLPANSTSSVLPDFSFGVYYYTQKYFIGFSLPYFLSHVPDETGRFKASNIFSYYNYFLTGGYEIGLTPRVKILPSVLLKYHPNNKIQVDYFLQATINERLGLGMGYRTSNVLIGMFHCHINDQLRIAYSYDFDSGSTGQYKTGSHEIVLGYVFQYMREVMGPREF